MANTVNLVTTFLPLVDEKFTTESRKSLLTNNDFDWTGAHSIKVYNRPCSPVLCGCGGGQ